MFKLNSEVSRATTNINGDDIFNVKKELNNLGYYKPDEKVGMNKFTDEGMFKGIGNFQKDNKLKVDEVMKPGGETEKTINDKLKSQSLFGATKEKKPQATDVKPMNSILGNYSGAGSAISDTKHKPTSSQNLSGAIKKHGVAGKIITNVDNLREVHKRRNELTHPDLRSGNGRVIVDKEKDWWDEENPAIAHNLHGASGNIGYRGKRGSPREGQQVIIDTNGKIVTTPENVGTPDFVTPDGFLNGYNHFWYDVVPWIFTGNSKDDKTTILERGVKTIEGAFKELQNKTRRNILRARGE